MNRSASCGWIVTVNGPARSTRRPRPADVRRNAWSAATSAIAATLDGGRPPGLAPRPGGRAGDLGLTAPPRVDPEVVHLEAARVAAGEEGEADLVPAGGLVRHDVHRSRERPVAVRAVELAVVLRARPDAVAQVLDVEEDALGAHDVAHPEPGGRVVARDADGRARRLRLARQIEHAADRPVGLGRGDDPRAAPEVPAGRVERVEGAARGERVEVLVLPGEEGLRGRLGRTGRERGAGSGRRRGARERRRRADARAGGGEEDAERAAQGT